MKLTNRIVTAVVAMLGVTAGCQAAENAERFVTIHSSGPGSLTLTDEARTAPFLKVTGDINSSDFSTLKEATINVTRVLDLSEAVIHENRVQVSDDSDWMVGGSTTTVTYPANTLPSGAFTELRDNSVSKFIRGSESLTKLILPMTLTGFMEGSLTSNYVLTEMEVPAGSTTLRREGNLIYSYDGTVLHAMPPAYYGDVNVAESVTYVAPGVFSGMTPASVTFTSAEMPTFGDDNQINAAYIMAKDAASFRLKFPDIDCISSMETIEISDPVPGQLLAQIVNLGFGRSDVRSVKVSGEISYDDFIQLTNLPNLHHADFSEAHITFNGQKQYTFSNGAITEFAFPEFGGPVALEISTSSRLSGHLSVPEGVWWFESSSPRFSSAEFPSTIQKLDDLLFRSYSVMESVDFSRCSRLEEIECLTYAGRLREVKLPANLKRLEGFGGPVETINLPNTIEYIHSPGGWLLEKLSFPASLTEMYLGSLPITEEIDASTAMNLRTLRGLNNTPHLKSLDLSMCPVRTLDVFSGDMYLPGYDGNQTGDGRQKLVASGNTKYPAPNVPGIEELKLPSTLQTLAGLSKCTGLKTLDLMHCFRLQKITGITDCPALETITLPESTLSISGIENCGAIRTVYSAGLTAPSYAYNGAEPLDFSRLTLYVGFGSAGAFRMADGWENCKDITEYGYRVSIAEEPLKQIFSDLSGLILDGAGLYYPGDSALLNGITYNHRSATAWIVDGNKVDSNPCAVRVEDHLTASPVYALDGDECDISMTIHIPVEQTVELTVMAYDLSVFVDGSEFASFSSSSARERTYSFQLMPGDHQIAMNSSLMTLKFGVPQAGVDGEDEYSVTDFKVNGKISLVRLDTRNFSMAALDLSNCVKLYSLISEGESRVGSLDVSGCPELYTVYFNDGVLEDFVGTDSSIESLDLSNNHLQALDLSGFEKLSYINASGNFITDFKMDAPQCQSLFLDNNPMAFSTLTRQMYDVYMAMMRSAGWATYGISFTIEDSRVDSNGILDLSGLMEPLEGGAPTVVSINGHVAESVDGMARYALGKGFSQIILTNPEYPDLRYVGSVDADMAVDGIVVDGGPCDVYTINGQLIRSDVPVGELNQIGKGTYIVRQSTRWIKTTR